MPSPLPPPAKTGRIIIVDDTVIHVTLLRGMLEPRGHTIVPLVSPLEALEETLERPPHVLMVDIAMPEMDGFTLVETLRAKGLPSETRVVFMTGGNRPDDAQRAASLGAADLIRKPFDTEDTIRRVESLIGAKGGSKAPGHPARSSPGELLSVLDAAWRLSLPESLLEARPPVPMQLREVLEVATARVSSKARERGVDLHVRTVEPMEWQGDRELTITVWSQVFDAAIAKADPGTAVVIGVDQTSQPPALRVRIECSPQASERMVQLAGLGPAGSLRIDRRNDGGAEIIIGIRPGP